MNIPYWAWIMVVFVVIQVIIQFKDNVVQPFIYFQF
jgi:hypothetical protein